MFCSFLGCLSVAMAALLLLDYWQCRAARKATRKQILEDINAQCTTDYDSEGWPI